MPVVLLSAQKSKSFICLPTTSPATEESDEPVDDEEGTQQKHEVYIGNLNYQVPTRTLIERLQELFRAIGVNVPDFRFTIFQRKSKKTAIKYGFILLSCEEEEELVRQLNGITNQEIVCDGHKLKVESRYDRTPNNKRSGIISFSKRLVRSSRSTPNINTIQCSNGSASATSVDQKSYDKEFCYGQLLPSEDRVTEYKRGSGKYLKKALVPTIRKYICAFLNSQGGHLLIGVDDNCKVYGVCCDRQDEDLARCQIDNVIKRFQPHVLPNTYVVDFIPVKLSINDHIEPNTTDPLLKVLEISVKKPMSSNVLYENDKGQVFVRRDGSIEGPLKATQIVEWCRINFSVASGSSATERKDDDLLDDQEFALKKLEVNLEARISKGQEKLEKKLESMEKSFEKRQNHMRMEYAAMEKASVERGITLVCTML